MCVSLLVCLHRLVSLVTVTGIDKSFSVHLFGSCFITANRAAIRQCVEKLDERWREVGIEQR